MYRSLKGKRHRAELRWLSRRIKSFLEDLKTAATHDSSRFLEPELSGLDEHLTALSQAIDRNLTRPAARDHRWFLRICVFMELEALVESKDFRFKLTNRRGAAGRVMVAVLEEADRLDGTSRRGPRYEFNLEQWRKWYQEYLDTDEHGPALDPRLGWVRFGH